mmetsp:Transcript_13696/g.43262  ORF Transcript_13696/g.43262 Transcript_13696/m.43262 type:complete len:240 (-) Transcript_13696:935-1654(-)
MVLAAGATIVESGLEEEGEEGEGEEDEEGEGDAEGSTRGRGRNDDGLGAAGDADPVREGGVRGDDAVGAVGSLGLQVGAGEAAELLGDGEAPGEPGDPALVDAPEIIPLAIGVGLHVEVPEEPAVEVEGGGAARVEVGQAVVRGRLVGGHLGEDVLFEEIEALSGEGPGDGVVALELRGGCLVVGGRPLPDEAAELGRVGRPAVPAALVDVGPLVAADLGDVLPRGHRLEVVDEAGVDV